jgi:hypothetical protein
MLLTDFMVTRVVEVAVHGLDLAAALGRPAWMTAQAADVVSELLVGPGGFAEVSGLGWEQVTFLAKATGRVPITDGERRRIDEAGVRWLALG